MTRLDFDIWLAIHCPNCLLKRNYLVIAPLTQHHLKVLAKTILKEAKKMATISNTIVDGNYGNYSIQGLGPDAETVENENGGRQSSNPYAFECLPPLALAKEAQVLAHGKKKYGRNNWTKITDPSDHVGKAMGHINAYNAGDTQEGRPYEHLAHALCRLHFALDVILRKEQEDADLEKSIEACVEEETEVAKPSTRPLFGIEDIKIGDSVNYLSVGGNEDTGKVYEIDKEYEEIYIDDCANGNPVGSLCVKVEKVTKVYPQSPAPPKKESKHYG